MTTYPRKVKIFTAWSKAMVEGATVDKPSYPGTSKTTKRRRRRRKKRKTHAKKD